MGDALEESPTGYKSILWPSAKLRGRQRHLAGCTKVPRLHTELCLLLVNTLESLSLSKPPAAICSVHRVHCLCCPLTTLGFRYPESGPTNSESQRPHSKVLCYQRALNKFQRLILMPPALSCVITAIHQAHSGKVTSDDGERQHGAGW